jgi:ribonuclease P protein component
LAFLGNEPACCGEVPRIDQAVDKNTPSKIGFRFKHEERLKSRADIGTVFKQGKSFACSGAKLFALKNDLSHNRIAFVFSRKFGNAVERNRSRRVSREAYRHLQHTIEPGFDLVLLVYPGKDDFAARLDQMNKLFKRANLSRREIGIKS